MTSQAIGIRSTRSDRDLVIASAHFRKRAHDNPIDHRLAPVGESRHMRFRDLEQPVIETDSESVDIDWSIVFAEIAPEDLECCTSKR